VAIRTDSGAHCNLSVRKSYAPVPQAKTNGNAGSAVKFPFECLCPSSVATCREQTTHIGQAPAQRLPQFPGLLGWRPRSCPAAPPEATERRCATERRDYGSTCTLEKEKELNLKVEDHGTIRSFASQPTSIPCFLHLHPTAAPRPASHPPPYHVRTPAPTPGTAFLRAVASRSLTTILFSAHSCPIRFNEISRPGF